MTQVSRWQPGGQLMSAVPVHSNANDERMGWMATHRLHHIYTSEVDCLWKTGKPGAPKESVLDAYRVQTEVDTDMGKNGDKCRLRVSYPASADDWIAELNALSTTTSERFYQIGEWIVAVRPGDQYAYTWARVTNDHVVKDYVPSLCSYRALAANTTMSSHNINEAAAALLRGRGAQASFVDGAGAALVVATFVSETFRRRETWGINLMLLDLIPNCVVLSRPLEWKLVYEEQLHPMCRGNTGDGNDPNTPALENGILLRWMQERVTVGGQPVGVPRLDNRRQFYAAQGLTLAEERVWQDSNSGQSSEAALRATVQRRIRNVEDEFSFERNGG
jgi:hypothetical protein